MDEIPEVHEPAPRMAMPHMDIEEDNESILSPPVQAASTTALAELARAVARERGVGLGRGGLTLEDLTREILSTLIKDWLDQNLPYMIERIVIKEIEKRVNRAEKL
jgi:cell pole-organizing protein PopZ